MQYLFNYYECLFLKRMKNIFRSLKCHFANRFTTTQCCDWPMRRQPFDGAVANIGLGSSQSSLSTLNTWRLHICNIKSIGCWRRTSFKGAEGVFGREMKVYSHANTCPPFTNKTRSDCQQEICDEHELRNCLSIFRSPAHVLKGDKCVRKVEKRLWLRGLL